jgi:hypothetical protein
MSLLNYDKEILNKIKDTLPLKDEDIYKLL